MQDTEDSHCFDKRPGILAKGGQHLLSQSSSQQSIRFEQAVLHPGADIKESEKNPVYVSNQAPASSYCSCTP